MKIRIYYSVCFFNYDFASATDSIVYYREVEMPCVPSEGQSLYLKFDPVLKSNPFEDGLESIIEETGYMEEDEIIPYIRITCDETFDEFFNSKVTYRDVTEEQKEIWEKHIKKQLQEAKDSFVENGWVKSDYED